jgi:hypothetical protein
MRPTSSCMKVELEVDRAERSSSAFIGTGSNGVVGASNNLGSQPLYLGQKYCHIMGPEGHIPPDGKLVSLGPVRSI